MLFFDTMLFFDLISVNPLFVADGVKKVNDVVIFGIVMQTFDVVLKKIHRPGVNRFDGVILFFGKGWTIGTKVWMIQHQTDSKYGADTK